SQKEKGAFKVQLPANASKGPERAAGLKLEAGEKSEGALLPFRAEQYIVIYRDIKSTKERAEKKDPNDRTDKEEIDHLIGKLLKEPDLNAKVENDQTMTVQGFPAREVRFQSNQGWYTIRIIVADTRVYSLVVHGVGARNEDDVRKFIDS